MEIVIPTPATKRRLIILHKEQIFKDVDLLTYKRSLSTPNVLPTGETASDSEDNLDGAILAQFASVRVATLKKRLSFCMHKESVVVVDNTPDLDNDFKFEFDLATTFDDTSLKLAAQMIHNYVVRGCLLDWYDKIGLGYSESLAYEVRDLESKVVDIFRVPAFVDAPVLPFSPSYKIR